MEALALAYGVLLPWLAGFAVTRACLTASGEADRWIEVGYGHFVGVLLVTLALRAQDALGVPLSVLPASIGLAIVAVGGVYLAWRWRVRGRAPVDRPTEATVLKWIAIAALVLIAIRVASLAVDVLMRPLFAWDAWSQWATKAKVWSSLRDIVPFIGYDEWLARDRPGYTDTAPNYPATIPLLQTWMTLVLGRWDDVLINLPWLAGYIALGLGAYGQFRRLGLDPTWSAVACYLVLSLPLLDAHVALAGYADFHIAAAYALAILALARWELSRSRAALILLGMMALLLPLLKIPGIAWLGTLALGAVIVVFGNTLWRMALLGAGVLACTVAAGVYYGSGKITPDAAANQYRIAESLVHHLLAFANWHLLWYLLPIVVVVAWQQVAKLKATAITLACGFAFLVWTFLFTQAGDWVVDYTTVNRALLHIAPAATAFCAVVAWRWARARAGSSAAQPLPTAAAANVEVEREAGTPAA